MRGHNRTLKNLERQLKRLPRHSLIRWLAEVLTPTTRLRRCQDTQCQQYFLATDWRQVFCSTPCSARVRMARFRQQREKRRQSQ